MLFVCYDFEKEILKLKICEIGKIVDHEAEQP